MYTAEELTERLLQVSENPANKPLVRSLAKILAWGKGGIRITPPDLSDEALTTALQTLIDTPPTTAEMDRLWQLLGYSRRP